MPRPPSLPSSPTKVIDTVRDVRVSTTEPSLSLHSVIKVIVGPEENNQIFFVHESLVFERAPFFRTAIKREGKEFKFNFFGYSHFWKGSNDQTIELPDDEPKIFFTYLQLLYTGKLPTKSPKAADPSDEYHVLIELYILAEKLQDVETRNIVMDAMLLKVREEQNLFSIPEVSRIFEGTPEGSPLREFAVDLFAEWGTESALHDKDGPLDTDFVFLLARKALKIRKLKGESVIDTCDSSLYHVELPGGQDRES